MCAMKLLMRGALTTAIVISLLVTAILGYVFKVELLHQVYVYREERIIVNLSEHTSSIGEDLLSFVIPPNMSGWQEVVSYKLFLNGIEEDIGREVNADGNKVLRIRNLESLEPGSKINLTFECTIKVMSNLLSFPLRVRQRIERGAGGDFSAIPVSMSERYCRPLDEWDWRKDGEWNVIRENAWNIRKDNERVSDAVIEAIKWVKGRIEYSETLTVLSPIETLEKGKGDCADQSALITTLLRAIGIPAYMVIAMYYEPTVGVPNEGGGRITVTEKGFLLHAFAMAYVPDLGWVPIDLTSGGNIIRGPEDYVNKAAIVMTDRVIATAIVNVSDPNNYLMFSAPKGLKVQVERSLRRVYHPTYGLILMVTLFVISTTGSTALIILAERLKKAPP